MMSIISWINYNVLLFIIIKIIKTLIDFNQAEKTYFQ